MANIKRRPTTRSMKRPGTGANRAVGRGQDEEDERGLPPPPNSPVFTGARTRFMGPPALMPWRTLRSPFESNVIPLDPPAVRFSVPGPAENIPVPGSFAKLMDGAAALPCASAMPLGAA